MRYCNAKLYMQVSKYVSRMIRVYISYYCINYYICNISVLDEQVNFLVLFMIEKKKIRKRYRKQFSLVLK